MTNETLIKNAIRAIPDFPKPGILFRDITTLISNPQAFKASIDMMVEKTKNLGINKIVAVESRGFIFGAPIALALDIPLVIIRKPGKLPYKIISEDYSLEYGTATLELHEDSISKGDKVVIVDDLLATGGTAAAAGSLVSKLGGETTAYLFTIELSGLKGRSILETEKNSSQVISLVSYQ
jgi:adenine phosphoribosyltransferase